MTKICENCGKTEEEHIEGIFCYLYGDLELEGAEEVKKFKEKYVPYGLVREGWKSKKPTEFKEKIENPENFDDGDTITLSETEKPTEFNLSSRVCFNEQRYSKRRINRKPYSYVLIKDIKTFIKKDTELINQFACGQITLLELKQEREKLAGDKLI